MFGLRRSIRRRQMAGMEWTEWILIATCTAAFISAAAAIASVIVSRSQIDQSERHWREAGETEMNRRLTCEPVTWTGGYARFRVSFQDPEIGAGLIARITATGCTVAPSRYTHGPSPEAILPEGGGNRTAEIKLGHYLGSPEGCFRAEAFVLDVRPDREASLLTEIFRPGDRERIAWRKSPISK